MRGMYNRSGAWTCNLMDHDRHSTTSSTLRQCPYCHVTLWAATLWRAAKMGDNKTVQLPEWTRSPVVYMSTAGLLDTLQGPGVEGARVSSVLAAQLLWKHARAAQPPAHAPHADFCKFWNPAGMQSTLISNWQTSSHLITGSSRLRGSVNKGGVGCNRTHLSGV